MNEQRIQELALQAGAKLGPYVHNVSLLQPDGTYKWDEDRHTDTCKINLKQFAKLVVKDMCDMMEQAEDDAYHCIEPSERPTEYIEWLNQWRTIFEERFGEGE